MNQEKNWWESKTLWVNLLTLLVGILTVIGGSEWIDPKITVVITGTAIPIANMILRVITNQPINLKGKK